MGRFGAIHVLTWHIKEENKMAHVLQMPRRKVLRVPGTGPLPATSAPASTEPVLETTLMEAMAIRKWLRFGLEDLHYQLRQMAADKTVSKRSFDDAKKTSALLSSYLLGVLGQLEERLSAETGEGE